MRALKVGLPLVISGALAALVVVLLRGRIQYDGIIVDLSSWGAFFNVFGVVYAIVAGFLLVTVLNRYGQLNQAVEDELNAIESIRDFLLYLDDGQRSAKSAMKETLARYVASLATTEWAEMGDPSSSMDSDTSEELYGIIREGKGIQVTKDSDRVVISALMDNISEVARVRTRRIALANEKLPPRLRLLMLFMSFALVAAFVMMGVQGIFTHVYMLVTLTVSIHLLYLVVEDLDHPFYGVWNINRAPLDELRRRFELEASQT
jgi:hypothetical protein